MADPGLSSPSASNQLFFASVLSNNDPTFFLQTKCLLLYVKGPLQRLPYKAPPKSIAGLNLLVPRARQAGGRCQWPMGGHGRHARTLDEDVTARAASCHSCLLRRLPSAGADSRHAQAMMTRRCSGLSPVPKARSDTPCQTWFDRRSRAAPGPS